MGGIDDRDKVSIIGIWCWCFFLQSLPLKGLMKFLPNLLSIISGCQTLKRMMNAVHCGVYVHSKKVQRSLSKSMAVDPPKKNVFLEIFLFEIWPSVQCMQVPCKSVGWRRPRRGRRTTAAASQKINTVSCHPYCQEVLRFFSLTCSSSSSFESLYKSVHIHIMHIQEI